MKNPIFTGVFGACHIQGIAVDKKNGYIYYSFTTKLIKATLDGEVVGSLEGLVGHLGCIAFNEADGRVYGSLEYKNDIIGKEIRQKLGVDTAVEDAFYIARFDVDKIARLGISAKESDIMKCIYLDEVVKDYHGFGKDKAGKTVPHKYGCSGIDGTTFAPLAGKTKESGMYLYVAYGIYSDKSRDDNDHQVLLCYDISNWDSYATVLDQENMHKNGPSAPKEKLFIYTGNTTYGVQNLEYDEYKNALFMAVYQGGKREFPNYCLFAADMSHEPRTEALKGLDEMGETLPLLELGECASGVRGWYFPHGSTGLCSLGGGKWLISHSRVQNGEQCADIFSYRWDDEHAFIQERN